MNLPVSRCISCHCWVKEGVRLCARCDAALVDGPVTERTRFEVVA